MILNYNHEVSNDFSVEEIRTNVIWDVFVPPSSLLLLERNVSDRINVEIYRFSSPSLFDQKNPRRVDCTINERFSILLALGTAFIVPLNFAIYQCNIENIKKTEIRKTFSISL